MDFKPAAIFNQSRTCRTCTTPSTKKIPLLALKAILPCHHIAYQASRNSAGIPVACLQPIKCNAQGWHLRKGPVEEKRQLQPSQRAT